MRKRRRQVVTRALELAGLVLVLLDAVLYLAMFRPVQSLVVSEQQRFSAARRLVRDEQARIERLQRFRELLPEADDKLDAFKRDHVPPRRRGFSRAARLLSNASEQSGIQVSSVGYRLDTEHRQPLERLGLEINVGGPFPGLLKFAHALETAGDFIVIREFSLEAAEGGTLAMRLAVDLYLVP